MKSQYQIHTSWSNNLDECSVGTYTGWYKDNRNRETHDWCEILLVKEGESSFGWNGKIWTIIKNDVLFISTNEEHAQYYPSNSNCFEHIWISFKNTNLTVARVCMKNDSIKHEHIYSGPLLNPVFHYFHQLWEKCTAQVKIEDILDVKFKLLASVILIDIDCDLISQNTLENKLINNLQSAIHYLDTHPKTTINLEELADMIGYSKHHFHRLFKEHSGMTFQQYKDNNRYLLAKKMLQEGTKPSLVSRELGFSSQNNFSQWFKKISGLLPKQVVKR